MLCKNNQVMSEVTHHVGSHGHMYNNKLSCDNMTIRDDIELVSGHKAARVNCWKFTPCERPYK